MRAAVLTEINRPLQILDLEQEPPKAGEVRVRVKAAAVCMSDWHIITGDWPLPLPMVPGHEAAGIAVECGPGTAKIAPGDPCDLFPILADLDMGEKVGVDSLISRTYRFDEFNEGFRLMLNGAVAPGVIVVD